jgi:hypothetical protein
VIQEIILSSQFLESSMFDQTYVVFVGNENGNDCLGCPGFCSLAPKILGNSVSKALQKEGDLS